jgi:hypothetical protein
VLNFQSWSSFSRSPAFLASIRCTISPSSTSRPERRTGLVPPACLRRPSQVTLTGWFAYRYAPHSPSGRRRPSCGAGMVAACSLVLMAVAGRATRTLAAAPGAHKPVPAAAAPALTCPRW